MSESLSIFKGSCNVTEKVVAVSPIVLSIIIILNVAYNLLLSDRLERIDKILMINKDEFEFKLRKELNNALEKDELIPKEDRELIIKFLDKIKAELQEAKN